MDALAKLEASRAPAPHGEGPRWIWRPLVGDGIHFFSAKSLLSGPKSIQILTNIGESILGNTYHISSIYRNKITTYFKIIHNPCKDEIMPLDDILVYDMI